MNCTVIPLNASPPRSSSSRTSPRSARTSRDGVITAAVKARVGTFHRLAWRALLPGRRDREVLDHDTAFRSWPASAGGQAGHAARPASLTRLLDDRRPDEQPFVPTKITPALYCARAARRRVLGPMARWLLLADFAVAFDAIFTIVRVLELLASRRRLDRALKQRIPAVAHKRAVGSARGMSRPRHADDDGEAPEGPGRPH